MPIRSDHKGRRRVEMSFIVPGTPDQVWRLMATGAGNCAWFTKTMIEERVGGAVVFDFGPNGTVRGEITAWTPPRHFAYVERDWHPGAPEVTTDITIEPRYGANSLVRMAHSIRTTANTWDAQLEAFESSWPVFFDVLRLCITHFPNMPAASFRALHKVKDTPVAVWTRLTTALNLASARVGEQRYLAPQPQPWIGVVEQLIQNASHQIIVLRLEWPAPGIALVGAFAQPEGASASVSAYFYGETAGHLAAHSEHSMREWLPQVFAESGMPSAVRVAT